MSDLHQRAEKACPADEAQPTVETRTVTIPASAEHDGYAALTLTLPWVCLVCGGPRGEPSSTISYDGSRRLHVHGWSNPCGHVESYRLVRDSLAGKPAASIAAAVPADETSNADNRPDFAAAILRMTGPEMRKKIADSLYALFVRSHGVDLLTIGERGADAVMALLTAEVSHD